MNLKNKMSAFTFSLLVCGVAAAQTSRNHIRTEVMLDSAGTSRMTAIRYYDGLGRLEQTVAAGASPAGADLVTHSLRDRAGRIIRQFSTTPSPDGGGYVEAARIRALAAEAYGDACPYTLTEYDRSPLGRQVSVTGPGQAWHSAGKSAKMTYHANCASAGELRCRLFSAVDTRSAADTVVTVTANGFYPAGELIVTKTVDEDGHTSLQFTDKQNRTVLTRALIGGGYADTYYVYEAAGNLTAVFPPAFSATVGNGRISSAEAGARDFAYFYIYDWRGRCRGRKLPGRDWQISACDKAGKAFLTQDGNMRKRGEAVFTLSDAFGRKCVTGIVKTTLSVANYDLDFNALVRRRASTDSLGGYELTDRFLTLPCDNLLSVTYYDDYSFLDGKAFSQELAYRNAPGYDSRYECAGYPSMSARGMQTGTATRILGDSVMLYKTVYYDYHGNVIQSHEQNAVGGYDHCYYRLSFTGKPLEVRHEHSSADEGDVHVYSYTYDNMERLLSVSVTKDGGSPVALARNAYDDFGRLRELRLGESREGTVQFGYNVRGWTTGVASPHFCQTLYHETGFGDSAPCWGGGISAIEWEAKEDLAAPERVRQAYRFRYDGLDRLTSADYSSAAGAEAGTAVSPELVNGRDYSCAYTYDLNGNITSLRRNGVSEVVTVADKVMWTFGVIDDLTLSYSGNQLKKVADRADDLTYSGAMDFKDRADKAAEYAYDANGNMTRDRNKKIHSISYNILNLPSEVRFNDGHIIRYTYDAAGTKLKAEYLLSDVRLMDWDDAAVIAGDDAAAPASLQTGGTGLPVVGPGGDAGLMPPGSEVTVEPVTLMTLEYSAGHVYRNGRLERVGNPYGYWADSTFHYHITDHQGNIRAVIAEDGTLEEINNYYPYGGLMGAVGTDVQPHKYGAKELDRENGLDLYDSHARWYDPLLARTTTQDPLAEKYRHLSPYAWCAGNPINLVDPNGRYIVGVDDCAVSYDEETKTWSSNASKDIIEICEAMMTTNMGTTQLDKMINKSDFPIYLKIELETSKDNHNQFGSTKNYYTITSEGEKHTGALIKIFKRAIELKGKDDDNFRNYDFSLKALVGFVAVHESEHALNPEAAKENVGEEKAEAVAKQAELAAIEEYVNKRNKK